MTLPKDVDHVHRLIGNMAEVSNLLDIHAYLSGTGPGRKHHVEILNKSAVVLIVACWEAFVEDTVQAALQFMVENCKDHATFPALILKRIASKHAGLKAWDLAGDGWKQALHDNLSEVLARTIGALNTPKTKQVNELFEKTIGLKNLSSSWKWKGRTVSQASKAIDDLITLRGSIAHQVKTSSAVHKKHADDAMELISRIAAKTSNVVRVHVHKQIGKYPWSSVKYKGTQ
jgi:hypothetical protein